MVLLEQPVSFTQTLCIISAQVHEGSSAPKFMQKEQIYVDSSVPEIRRLWESPGM